jgi:hypothetical protein
VGLIRVSQTLNLLGVSLFPQNFQLPEVVHMKEKVQKILVFVVRICIVSKIFSFPSFVHMKEKV